MAPSKHLTGDPLAIKDFIDRFDVSFASLPTIPYRAMIFLPY